MLICRQGLVQSARHGSRLSNCLARSCWQFNQVSTPSWRCRLLATTSTPPNAPEPARDVAILGGGISGLATAYYLARHRPDLAIDIYDRNERLGGWMQATEQTTPDGQKILFEQGPRTLRTAGINAKLALALVAEIGLGGEIEICSKKSPMAQNRFVYLNGRLDRMPSSLWDVGKRIVFNPPWTDLGRNVFVESYKARPPLQRDISVGEFIEQRAGNHAAVLASAMMHGIYAGDAWKLSVKSLMPYMVELERRHGNIIRGYLRDNSLSLKKDAALQHALDTGVHTEFLKAMGEASIFYFKGGLQTLARGIEAQLRKMPNVSIFSKIGADKVAQSSYKSLDVELSSGEKKQYQKVISTLSSQSTASITEGKLKAIADIPAATVMVLNLYFPNPNLIRTYQGFGYLIPQSKVAGANPGNVLGVIFDSYVTPRLDAPNDASPATPGTKITVMMGGHYWSGRTEYPSKDEALISALLTLKSHLGITDFPSNYNITLQKNCIAQYNVGHGQRLAHAHEELKDGFGGRLAVVGSSYNGVGVNDCIRAAFDFTAEYSDNQLCTGLESAVQPPQWLSGLDMYNKA